MKWKKLPETYPLSPVVRPAWDMKVLKNLASRASVQMRTVWQRVWSDTEKSKLRIDTDVYD